MSGSAALLAGVVALVFTALMMFQRSLYVGALCLLAVLLQTAVVFYFLGSPLLAFLQVMIYAGAVMVLVVVAIMAAPPSLDRIWSRLSIPWPAAALGLLLLSAQLALLPVHFDQDAPGAGLAADRALGSLLFGPYAAATEAVTVLLLLSTLAVAGRRREEKR